MRKRLFFFMALAVVTVGIALLLIPKDEWTTILALCFFFVLLAEAATLLAPIYLCQASRSMLPWNLGMSTVPLIYLLTQVGLFALAMGGLGWRVLLSCELVALLGFVTVVTVIRSAGSRAVSIQEGDRRTYDTLVTLRLRVGKALDQLTLLSVTGAKELEEEGRAYCDQLRYAVPIMGIDARAGSDSLFEAVQRMEAAVEALQQGDNRQDWLAEFRSQIRLSQAFLQRRSGAVADL